MKVYLHFLNHHKILHFFKTQYDLLQAKENFTSQRGHFSNFWTQSPKKGRNRPKQRKIHFLKTSWKTFPNQKTPEALTTFKITVLFCVSYAL
jgi:hypothetical protein